MSSHLHLLAVGSMLGRPSPGCVRRQRTEVAGVSLAVLDAEVEAAGGRIMHTTIKSNSLRGGRLGQTVVQASWYELPAAAVEAP